MLDRPTAADLHLSAGECADYLSGKIAQAGEVERIEGHLATCEFCQQMASQIQPDEFESAIRKSARSHVQPTIRVRQGYELIDEVGRGSSGIVYRAIDQGLGRTVALKMLLTGGDVTASELARYKRESEALACLDHPNVVKVYEVGEQDGTPFLALEWMSGGTLAQYLKHHRLSPIQSARLLVALGKGLQHAHDHAVLHRDLKPHNILLQGDFHSSLASESQLNSAVKIADFGLARLENSGHFQTRTGESLGTPSYMAPEQVLGRFEQIGPRTDVYGLGAIFYQCLTGLPPFRGASVLDTMQLVNSREPTPVRELNSAVPRDLAVICHRCLAKSPAKRFASAGEMVDDLNRFLSGQPIRSRSVSTLEKAWRWAVRNPWPVAALALVSLSIVSLIVVQTVNQLQLTRQRDQSESNYQSARQTVSQLLEISQTQSIFEIPKLKQMILDQTLAALPLFERLALEEQSEQARLDLAKTRMLIGTILISDGRTSEAEPHLKLALEDVLALQKQSESSADRVSYLISAQVKLAILSIAQRKADEAIQMLAPALAMANEAVGLEPDSVKAIDNLAWIHHIRGTAHDALGQAELAAHEFQRAVELRSRARAVAPDRDFELQERMAGSQVNLAKSLIDLGRIDEGIDVFEQATETFQSALKQSPNSLSLSMSAAIANLNASNVYASREEWSRANDILSQGITILTPFHQASPEDIDVRNHLFMLYANRALYRQGDTDADLVVEDWRRAIELAPSMEESHRCAAILVRVLAEHARFEAAMVEASALQEHALSTTNQFQLAAAWASLAFQIDQSEAGDEEQKNGWLEQAVERSVGLLTGLVENGYFDSDHGSAEYLRSAAEFQFLRDRCGDEKLRSLLAK